MFITTANLIDPIPEALEDRMEIIRLPGYTEEDKLKIAKKYLLPRQLKEHGLGSKIVTFSDGAVNKVITEYTQEAGLRGLERKLAAICRKVARKVAEGETGPYKIMPQSLSKYLGPPEILPEPGREEGEVGVATGLAWTEAGGDLLYIEARVMAGKGNLSLTGQLGEVMKESAQAALSFARSRAKTLKLDEDFYENLDIHIHVPAGAIPKDGPSAGVTMTAALLSALTDRPVPRDLAMTGEITLRGKIMAIGGLREKALAALRYGINKIVIPEQNLKDLNEMSPQVKRKAKFIPVKDMDQFLGIVFPEPEPKKPRAKTANATPTKARSKKARP